MRHILDDCGLEYCYPETACDRLIYDLAIQKCLDRVHSKTGMRIDRILDNLGMERMQSVLLPGGSVIVAAMYRNGLVTINAASGKLRELVAALPKLETWYRRRGALRIMIAGRYGWERALRGQGYTRDGQTLVKEC